MQMPIVSSRYWNVVHGTNPEEVRQDLEGMQVMQVLGNNMAFFISCKNITMKMGLEMPKAPVELLGMKVIDELIQDEVSYYKEIYKQRGLRELLDSL